SRSRRRRNAVVGTRSQLAVPVVCRAGLDGRHAGRRGGCAVSIIDDLRSLDTNDPGRWPLPIRIGAVALTFVAVFAFGTYMFVVKEEMPRLERAQQEERELRTTFEDRQRKAA